MSEEENKVQDSVPPTPTGDEQAQPESEQPSKEAAANWAAVSDEREKRRQAVERAERLEQEVAYMRGQMEALNRQATAEPEQDPNQAFLEDPAGFVVSQVKNVRAEMDEREWKLRVNLDAAYARQGHDDFDDKAIAFSKMAQKDPVLMQQFRSSETPARFAYEYVTKQEEVQKYGSADKLREAIEAEVIAKLRKAGAIADASKVPPSIADKGQAGSGGAPKRARAVDDYYSKKPF